MIYTIENSWSLTACVEKAFPHEAHVAHSAMTFVVKRREVLKWCADHFGENGFRSIPQGLECIYRVDSDKQWMSASWFNGYRFKTEKDAMLFKMMWS